VASDITSKVMNRMKNPIATWTLWCRRGESLIEFEVELGAPYREEEIWRCDWSLGTLIDHLLSPAQSISSMHALACAQVGISEFLRARQKAGDQFYMDQSADDTELIEDLDCFFPRLKRLNHDA
jgi:hypothetical protein